ncbi:hypothetical protein CE91St41_04490 [Oscillospiraceae bacterium]|nr:hypothetical protein CE91St40_04510 [Oscillospiraceae bacterium]BDF73560.1 hypothetical protein CE91St41_04490 [Oscillospiraceae bacterium]
MNQEADKCIRYLSTVLYFLQTGMCARGEALGLILSYFCESYFRADAIHCPEDIPIFIYSMLYDSFGLAFIIRAGKIASVSLEEGGSAA